MSVIITNMNMPDTCKECPLATEKCLSTAEYTELDKRAEGCTVKSVDGLIKEMKFFAKRQEEIALAINDEDKRYAHIQVANAYHHCVQVIEEYCKEEQEE